MEGGWIKKLMALVEDSRLRIKLPDCIRIWLGRGPRRRKKNGFIMGLLGLESSSKATN
jgi:hypothetical protein